jgi:Putative beta-lactamase-inhibitor-like, PepSY-like
MKKLFFMAVAIGVISVSACGQKLRESQVPSATKAAFTKKYPGLKGSWEKENGNYEVNFRQDNKTMSAVIEKNGTIVETETVIPISDLPQSASTYVKEHYKGAKIKEAAKIVKANGEVNYEAEINHKDVVFDANGKFIREAKD